MRIVVIGGSGLIGAKLVNNLRHRGQDVLSASPCSGVNTITDEGLAEAVAGAQVVVDVTDSASGDDEAVMEFFRTSCRNLLNPWVSLYWLVTGKTIGGLTMHPQQNRFDRTTALRLWTEANTWFSNEEGKKGAIKVGQLADLAVLSADYMSVAEEEIKNLASVLTVLGGNVVHGDGPFRKLSPPLPPASPDWSPVNNFGGYYEPRRKIAASDQSGFRNTLRCNCWTG